MAEKRVTLTLPHLKSQHYIVLIQVTIFKNKNKGCHFFLPESLKLDRTQGKRRQILIHIHRQAFALLHTCTLTNEHSHIAADTHIRQTSRHFSPSDVRALFSSLQWSGRKKKISIWFKWHHREIFLVYFVPKNWKKINYI